MRYLILLVDYQEFKIIKNTRSLKIIIRKGLSQISIVKSIQYSIGTDYCSSQAAATNGGGGGPNQFWETSVSAKWHSAPQARAYPTSNAHTQNTLNTLNSEYIHTLIGNLV